MFLTRLKSPRVLYGVLASSVILASGLGSCSFDYSDSVVVSTNDRGERQYAAKPIPSVSILKPDGSANLADIPVLVRGEGRKHVIVMIGDGMQMASEVATSRYLYDLDQGLSFHALPVRAFKTTWEVNTYDARAVALGVPPYSSNTFDPTVGYDPSIGGGMPYPLLEDSDARRTYFVGGPAPDSAATATAMSTGIKTYYSAIGVPYNFTGDNALEHASALLRRFYGMAVGFVTTVEFYHATPAGFFAHNASRNAYSEIAHELITQVMPNVMIGAGYGLGVPYPEDLAQLETSGKYVSVHRQDGVDGNDVILSASARAVQENRRLFGLFGNTTQGNFASPVPVDNPGNPSIQRGAIEDPTLAIATTAALQVLAQDPDGFFLLVEQGDIDRANHNHDFSRMIGCVSDLDAAVRTVTEFVDKPNDKIDWSNTTLIVTADHANGYLRFGQTMHNGDLPSQNGSTYPDGEITYYAGGHTSELTNVYVKGFAENRVADYATVYPKQPILDDTSIYRLILDGARR